MSVSRHQASPLFPIGAHTDEWRTLSFEVGDEMADKLCEWADRQPDPNAAVAAAISTAIIVCQDTRIANTSFRQIGAHERRREAFAILTGEPDRWQE